MNSPEVYPQINMVAVVFNALALGAVLLGLSIFVSYLRDRKAASDRVRNKARKRLPAGLGALLFAALVYFFGPAEYGPANSQAALGAEAFLTTLKPIKKRACACTTEACARNALSEFKQAADIHKNAPMPPEYEERIRKAGSDIGFCLGRLGISLSDL